jgi:hypothetical protein
MWPSLKLLVIGSRSLILIWGALCGLCFVPLFLAMYLLGLHYGGYAILGYTESGHYFVAQHDTTAEVTRTVYERMLLLERSALVAIISFFVATAIYGVGEWLSERRRKAATREDC